MLPNADSSRTHNGQPVSKIQLQKATQPFSDERQNNPSPGSGWAKQNHASVVVNWILLEIGDALVQRKENPLLSSHNLHQHRILRTGELLIEDGLRIMAQLAKVGHEFTGQILVNLELHDALRGSKRSSCANSAA